jgi:ATP-dependent Clp protease adapter protein ClpS
VAGVYTYEIAETKVAVAEAHAARHEHPLQLVMEPED